MVRSSIRRMFFAFAFSALALADLGAQELQHPAVPVGIVSPSPTKRAVLPEATVKINGLRAVMLGGNVDGPEGASTVSYRNYLKRVATVLRARGVNVAEIYSGTSTEAIRSAVRGAHFIFYAGHGIGSSNPPSYNGNISPAGMLVVDKVWSGANDVASWEPARGAIVVYLGACFTAGNSGDDIGRINDDEAKRRVSNYSAPFFRNRFGGYYATWSDADAQSLVAQLFAGQSLGGAYDAVAGKNGINRSPHPLVTPNELWYRRSPRGGGFAFDFSFVGRPDSTLTTLFAPTQTQQPSTDSTVTQTDQSAVQTTVNPEQAREYGLQLMQAIADGRDDEANRLLSLGADTTVRHKGWTPLMLAVYFDRIAVVRSLIAKGVDLNASMDGWTALSLAKGYRRNSIVEVLQQAGAQSERAIPAGRPQEPGRKIGPR